MGSTEIRNLASRFRSTARIRASEDRYITVEEYNDLVDKIADALKRLADAVE